MALQSNLSVIHVINQQIEILQARILSYLKKGERFRALKTIPEIGDILAMTIVLETGEIDRFPKLVGASYHLLSNGKEFDVTGISSSRVFCYHFV